MRRATLLPAALSGCLLLAACSDRPAPVAPEIEPAARTASARAIPGHYIVVFRAGTPDPAGLAHRLTATHRGSLRFSYTHALEGFAAALSAPAVAALRQHPSVAYIEEDQVAEAMGAGTESPATWGLDRIDDRDLPLDGSYDYEDDGQGVTAYIIDTGIRTSHAEFGGRASVGYDAIGDGQNGNDCNGHGTHVAGTVGGGTYGVAQAVSLVAVRVLNCSGSGSYSQVIAGVNWVTGHHAGSQPAVANMSLGGGFSQALNDAVASSVADGVLYAVAAGNSSANACNYSPASTPSAVTVGSTTSTDARSSFSNYGTCLDLFAPGSSITSAWHTSNTATNTISGTSMAAPHVAGAAALYMDLRGEADPAVVAAALLGNATTGKVTSAGTGSPDRLLFTRFDASAPPPPAEGAIVLTARGYKVKGRQKVELEWTGTSAPVEILRGGAVVGTDTASPYVDNINSKGGGTYTHQVCTSTGTRICSNTTTTTF